MQTSSTSIIRRSSSAALAYFLRRTAIYHGGGRTGVGIRRSFRFLSSRRENPNDYRKHSPCVLSWDDKPALAKSDAIGTVMTAQANYMRVIVHDDGSVYGEGDERSSNDAVELLCVVKAVLKKIEREVLVGDKVLVGEIDWVDRRGMIVNVFQRLTVNLDPPVANVDHLLILFSLDQPKPEPFTLTRFLVEAESMNIPVTLALNKCELVTEEELESWKIRLRGWNYEPLFCSVEAKLGLDAIALVLRNHTSVIVGPSGVGKSSLINVLRSSIKGFEPMFGIKWYESVDRKSRDKKKWFEDQDVRNVSSGNGGGRHTTRNVTLLPLCGGGYLADTPGLNKHKLQKVTKKSLPMCFPEIRKMVEGGQCTYKDCSHLGVPGCAVKESGWERYHYYVQLLDEVGIEQESQLKKFGTKKESDIRRYKVKPLTGKIQAEPRLDPKKYQRESRKKMKQKWISELDD